MIFLELLWNYGMALLSAWGAGRSIQHDELHWLPFWCVLILLNVGRILVAELKEEE